MFQSTLPRGERRLFAEYRERLKGFQSTLPRGERHGGRRRGLAWVVVSIHAPAWGATQD